MDTILAIIVEPPADALALMIRPTPNPIMTPPKTEATKIFFINKSKVKELAKKSMKKDMRTIVMMVLMAKILPKYFVPKIRSGILIAITIEPTEKPVRWCNNIAIPGVPPVVKLWGKKNSTTESDIHKVPNIINMKFFISFVLKICNMMIPVKLVVNE